MRDNYRNDKYIELKCSDNYKTIVIINKNSDVLEYLSRYGKKIDYILNCNDIKIDKKYKNIELIDLKKLLTFKTTNNLIIDDLTIKFLNS